MRLLVLDLATHLGFAFGTEAGVIEHGAYKLPSTGADIGAFLFAYRAWLMAALSRFAPLDEVVFEMPILPDTTNIATLRKLYSLAGITELVVQDQRIGCSEANLMDIRRHFIGSPRAPRDVPVKERRAWIKDATMTMCRRRGFKPVDDNDADALAMFSLVMGLRHPGFELLGSEIDRETA